MENTTDVEDLFERSSDELSATQERARTLVARWGDWAQRGVGGTMYLDADRARDGLGYEFETDLAVVQVVRAMNAVAELTDGEFAVVCHDGRRMLVREDGPSRSADAAA